MTIRIRDLSDQWPFGLVTCNLGYMTDLVVVMIINHNFSANLFWERQCQNFVEVYKATQLNSTQLNCQLSIRRRRVGGSERRDPVEVVCGSWRHVWCKITTKFANLCDRMTG